MPLISRSIGFSPVNNRKWLLPISPISDYLKREALYREKALAMKKRTAPAILITGSPGSGKSTLMARLIKDIGAGPIAGLSTPEVRKRDLRVGFKMIDLASGKEEVLASTSGKGPTVGKYHVNIDAIDTMVKHIEETLPSARFIFIDEIGKMELFSSRFKQFVDRVFLSDKPVVAVVHRALVPEYRDRGRLFSLTRDNFEDVRTSILSELKSQLD